MCLPLKNLRIIAALPLLTLTFVTLPALPAAALDLPNSERNIFILDISGSTNAESNWVKSLRPSIVTKLKQPFGQPKNSSKPSSPEDIYVTSITANSVDAELFPILTREDAETVWGMVDRVGIRPKTKRLDEISADLFGGDGIWTKQSKVFLTQPLSVPKVNECKKAVMTDLEKSVFFRSKSSSDKLDVANVTCETIINISKRLIIVDQYFDKPKCGSTGACSDIVGAIQSAAASAQDLYGQSPRSSLCIAIASDMLNSYPGMSKESILNTRKIVETSSSVSEANQKGQQGAIDSAISFPKKLEVRVAVLGIGTGKNPLPREKTSMLNAYWNGFWTASGIRNFKQVVSLNKACAKK